MESPPKLPVKTHVISSTTSPEFTFMLTFLRRSSVIALDAEWKPVRRQRDDDTVTENSSASSSSSSLKEFPTVTVLQIACRCRYEMRDLSRKTEVCVFVVDLMAVPAVAIWESLREVFVSPDVIKLGFRLKQDLIFLSSTFASQGCHPGFSEVVPFLDITSIYYHLQTKQSVKKIPKETKSLATICKEVLGVTLSKELQCSDWSCRPLTKEQISYAAADAYYLLEIFDVFRSNITCEGSITSNIYAPNVNGGLKEIFEKPNYCDNILQFKFCQAPDMVKSSGLEILSLNASTTAYWPSSKDILPFDYPLTKVIKNYCEHILLKESDRKPRTSKKKGKRRHLVGSKVQIQNEINYDCEGLPLWDPSLGGDGCPKFLCDVMVEGLAKQLRCVGFDAAVPSSRKPEIRQLIDQAYKEKRVLLTRDAKLLRYHYLIPNQVYKIKSLLKNEQLLEVIGTFKLKVREEQLMSRCTKCNGMFIQKPLSIEEAVEASKGFQIIPDCLFKKDLEFWQCMDCNQLYWEGTQYHNAVQKFIDVCKLNERATCCH